MIVRYRGSARRSVRRPVRRSGRRVQSSTPLTPPVRQSPRQPDDGRPPRLRGRRRVTLPRKRPSRQHDQARTTWFQPKSQPITRRSVRGCGGSRSRLRRFVVPPRQDLIHGWCHGHCADLWPGGGTPARKPRRLGDRACPSAVRRSPHSDVDRTIARGRGDGARGSRAGTSRSSPGPQRCGGGPQRGSGCAGESGGGIRRGGEGRRPA